MHFKTHYLEPSWKLQKGQQELLINVFGGLLPVIYKYYPLVCWDLLPDGVSSCYKYILLVNMKSDGKQYSVTLKLKAGQTHCNLNSSAPFIPLPAQRQRQYFKTQGAYLTYCKIIKMF